MSQELEFTGERFIPGTAGEIWHEHWHRYHFAAPLVAGLDVLDVACGEGYGSALLAARASSVIGADIAAGAVEHARSRYAAIPEPRIPAGGLRGACRSPMRASTPWSRSRRSSTSLTQAPFWTRSAACCVRTASSILSCPEQDGVQRPPRGDQRISRPRALSRRARRACSRRASRMCFGTASGPSFYSVLWPEQGAAQGEIFEVSEGSAAAPSPGHARPLYFVVLASASGRAARRDRAARCRCSPIATSGCTRTTRKVMRDLDATHARANDLDRGARRGTATRSARGARRHAHA